MIRLRPFKRQDIENMLHWMPEERAFAMWSANLFQFPLNLEEMNAYVQKQETDASSFIMAALDERGELVGHFLVRNIDYVNEAAHIGFIVLDPTCRGKGYGKEMLRKAMQYAFSVLQVKKVTLRVFDSNPAAISCYEAVGFEVQTVEKASFQYKDEKWDCILMKIDGGKLRPSAI